VISAKRAESACALWQAKADIRNSQIVIVRGAAGSLLRLPPMAACIAGRWGQPDHRDGTT